MDNARLQWAVKREELQSQMENNASYRIIQNNVLTSSKSNIFTSFNLSPFSVLVQLFAYEEVIANGRLDACFDIDDGAGLTFYVPQLLTFLLHGAYLNSHDLETWLLGKCKLNVNFAHRCFWFLRSWCLGGGENHASENNNFSEN